MAVGDLARSWSTIKNVLSDVSGLSHTAWHVVAGLLLYPVFARLMRRPLGSWRPLVPIAVLELARPVVVHAPPPSSSRGHPTQHPHF